MKIGFISMPLVDHINTMTALAREMQSRGHEIVFLGIQHIVSLVWNLSGARIGRISRSQ
jgi:UDP:flavonoid glycosyltransferase YjiC (YdhE family)